MGRYRKIDPRIWNDAKFRTLSDRGKLTFLFILTHPYMTSLGAMRATISGLAEELHWELKAFREVFGEGLSKGLFQFDAEASFLGVPNFLKYNPPENPNVVKSWGNILDLIPECQLKVELFEYVKDFLKGFGAPFLKAMPKELERVTERVCQNPSPIPSPNPNPIEDTPLTPQKGDGYDQDFNLWWKEYPPRRGMVKPEVFKKWKALKKSGNLPEIESMLAILQMQKRSNDWQKQAGEYIPGPGPYLNKRKFLDESALRPHHNEPKGFAALRELMRRDADGQDDF